MRQRCLSHRRARQPDLPASTPLPSHLKHNTAGPETTAAAPPHALRPAGGRQRGYFHPKVSGREAHARDGAELLGQQVAEVHAVHGAWGEGGGACGASGARCGAAQRSVDAAWDEGRARSSRWDRQAGAAAQAELNAVCQQAPARLPLASTMYSAAQQPPAPPSSCPGPPPPAHWARQGRRLARWGRAGGGPPPARNLQTSSGAGGGPGGARAGRG